MASSKYAEAFLPNTAAPPGSSHILIVDDEPFIRSAFRLYFETIGFRVSVAKHGDEALDMFKVNSDQLDVVLLDLAMPGIGGMDVLRQMKRLDPSVEIIIATGCGSVKSAVEALKHGAYNYVTKPVVNLDEDLLTVVQAAVVARQMRIAEEKRFEALSVDEPAARTRLRFYLELEAVAQKAARLAPPDSSYEAVNALGAFLERHMGAVAAGAFRRGGKEPIAWLARWGMFRETSTTSGSKFSPETWGRLLEGRTGWHPLESEALAPADLESLGFPHILEGVNVPLSFSAAAGGPRREGCLLVIRRVIAPAASNVPGLDILGLVAARVLFTHAMSME
ncbi:MAG TPA: response regulator [Planctomycetota bacterium]|nr:response regulator [Planctomycetota bacterium]